MERLSSVRASAHVFSPFAAANRFCSATLAHLKAESLRVMMMQSLFLTLCYPAGPPREFCPLPARFAPPRRRLKCSFAAPAPPLPRYKSHNRLAPGLRSATTTRQSGIRELPTASRPFGLDSRETHSAALLIRTQPRAERKLEEKGTIRSEKMNHACSAFSPANEGQVANKTIRR